MTASFRILSGNEAAVLRVDGALDAGCTMEYFRFLRQLEELVAAGAGSLEMFQWDLSKVSSIDLCGTGMLVVAFKVAESLPILLEPTSEEVRRWILDSRFVGVSLLDRLCPIEAGALLSGSEIAAGCASRR